MNIDIVKKSLKRWNEIRKTELGLTFLTSGYGFEIQKSEYDKWEKIKENATDKKQEEVCIHMYIGILEFEIVFYLIDSISDENNDYRIGETLFYKNFTKENLEVKSTNNDLKEYEIPDVKIEDNKAVSRAFKWFMFSNKWAHNKLKTIANKEENEESGIVRVFTIPFNDFTETLKVSNKAFLYFGLNNKMKVNGKKSNKDEIEVLLSSENGFLPNEPKSELDKNVNESEDVTSPHPPFSIKDKDFNLFLN